MIFKDWYTQEIDYLHVDLATTCSVRAGMLVSVRAGGRA
jgi:hypothetical protein